MSYCTEYCLCQEYIVTPVRSRRLDSNWHWANHARGVKVCLWAELLCLQVATVRLWSFISQVEQLFRTVITTVIIF